VVSSSGSRLRNLHSGVEVTSQLSDRRDSCGWEGPHHDPTRQRPVVQQRQPVADDVSQSPAYPIAYDGAADHLTDDEADLGARRARLGGRSDMDDHGRAAGPQPSSQDVGELWAAA
jgi:hypothetical protein